MVRKLQLLLEYSGPALLCAGECLLAGELRVGPGRRPLHISIPRPRHSPLPPGRWVLAAGPGSQTETNDKEAPTISLAISAKYCDYEPSQGNVTGQPAVPWQATSMHWARSPTAWQTRPQRPAHQYLEVLHLFRQSSQVSSKTVIRMKYMHFVCTYVCTR